MLGTCWRYCRYATLPRIRRLADLPAVVGPDIRAISLDCFDTLVHRRTDPPQQVIRAWAARVADAAKTYDPGDILRVRMDTETRLRASSAALRDGEITLPTLHAEIGRSLGMDPVRLIEIEEECERAVLYPADDAIEVLQRLRAQGLRIAVLSDMYWEEERLGRLLRDMGLLTTTDILLVSGCQGVSKFHGGLFLRLIERLELPARAILHVGDHPVSDVISPRSRGIAARWLHDTTDLRRRARLRTSGADGPGTFANLDVLHPLPDVAEGLDDASYLIGRDVLGPALVLFVHAVLTSIARSDVPAIAGFVARDGWLPMCMAQRLRTLDQRLDRSLTQVKHVYLHLSRRSCLPAATHDPLVLLRDLAGSLSVHGSVRAVARLLGLNDDEIDRSAGSGVVDAPFTTMNDVPLAVRNFLGQPGVSDLIALRRAGANRALLGYLSTIGVLGGSCNHLHLIDLGWRSTIQNALTSALAGQDQAPSLTGHLFGNLLTSRTLAGNLRSTLQPGVVVDAHRPDQRDGDVARAISLLEIACQPDEGSTLAYTQDVEGQWLPLLGEAPPAASRGMRSAIQAGVMVRLEQLAPLLRDGIVTSTALMDDAKTRIADFVTHPSQAQAKVFRNAAFDVDVGTHARIKCVDADLTPMDLIPPHRLLRRIRSVSWVEGSLVASQIPGGLILHRTWLAWRAVRQGLRSRWRKTRACTHGS